MGNSRRHCVEFYASPTPTATPTATSTDAIIYQDCILDSALIVQTDFMLSAMTKTYGRKGKDLNVLSSTAIDNIFKAGRNSTINKQYDLLGRITTRKITTGSYAGTGYNANYETRYSYIDKTGGASTYLLESLTNKDKTITYTYDADGNIESIIQPVNGVNI